MGMLIAVIGGGGKTTAMKLLGKQWKEGSVLLTTTTHIFPMEPPDVRACLTDPGPEALEEALRKPGILCAGSRADRGKLGRLPEDVCKQGIKQADLMVYEADGSRGLPLKLHRPGEPVILPGTHRCLVVAGLSAVGKPVGQAVHRYELEKAWKDAPRMLTAQEEALRCILETAAASGLSKSKIKVFLNQADSLAEPETALRLAHRLKAQGLDTRWGSLQAGEPGLLDWLLQEPDPFGGG